MIIKNSIYFVINNSSNSYNIINSFQSLDIFYKNNFLLKNDNSSIFVSFYFKDDAEKTKEELYYYSNIINNILLKNNIHKPEIYYHYNEKTILINKNDNIDYRFC